MWALNDPSFLSKQDYGDVFAVWRCWWLPTLTHTSSNQKWKGSGAKSLHLISTSLHIQEQNWNCCLHTRTHTQIISTLPVVVSIICSIAPGLEWQVDVVCGDLVSLNHRSSAETWGGLKNKSGRQGTEEIFQNKISTLSSGERCIKML